MARLLYMSNSMIDGKGCFAGVDLIPGILIPIPGHDVKDETKFNLYREDESMFMPYNPFCFLNHSENNNADVYEDEDGNFVLLIAKVIKADQEITIDYGEGWDEYE